MLPEIAEVMEGKRRWAIVEGDCLGVMPTLADRSVDHVITDPPYSAGLYARMRTNKAMPNSPKENRTRRKQVPPRKKA